MSKVFNPWCRPPSRGTAFKSPSLTRQEFAADADLNNIMRRYAAGLAPIPAGNREPMYGDWSSLPDYQASMQIMIDAQDRFDSLPSAVRKRFDNDPANLLAFLADDTNRDEAVRLGLIDPPTLSPLPQSHRDNGSTPPKSNDVNSTDFDHE